MYNDCICQDVFCDWSKAARLQFYLAYAALFAIELEDSECASK